MRHHLLAADFDGTLAEHGLVPDTTVESLRRLRESGRRLVMVSGRRLEPLLELCPWITLFDRVVAENGALLYRPESRESELLTPAPPADLEHRLRAAGVDRVESGRVIVATWRPHEIACLEVIRELALDLQIIFNKDAVMLLPSGCNKATGLLAALAELEVSALNTVAVGDAENDEPLLRAAAVSVAVDNALPIVKAMCDIVTPSPRGAGVAELCEMIMADDLASLSARADRGVRLGERLDRTPLMIPAHGESVFVTGGPAGGKSKFAMSFFEQLDKQGAQCCVVDPEGDYHGITNSLTIGAADRAPAIEEVIELLRKPVGHTVVSFFAVEKPDRPEYFNRLFRALAELRSRTGRPHWIIVDEAHYMAPAGWQPAEDWHRGELKSIMFITAYHDRISAAVLDSVDWVVSIADEPQTPIIECAQRLGEPEPRFSAPPDGDAHHALAWRRGDKATTWFSRPRPESEGRRHRTSLMDGALDDDQRFVFRGSGNQLRLVAKNLSEFIGLADGLDDETWLFHLRRGDYSQWFREVIKDSELTASAERAERDKALTPRAGRDAIIQAIRERFETAGSRRE